MRPETHILYLDAVPNEVRATAGHRHCKTHSTAFLEDLRGSPYCPAALERAFLADMSFHVSSPLPIPSVVHAGE